MVKNEMDKTFVKIQDYRRKYTTEFIRRMLIDYHI